MHASPAVEIDLAQTPLPRVERVAMGYFERALPVTLILGAFFAVALPMAAVVLFRPDILRPGALDTFSFQPAAQTILRTADTNTSYKGENLLFW